MTDILGPASDAFSVTTRATDARTFGANDTFFVDCSSPTAGDGTDISAEFLNALIANARAFVRVNGSTAAGAKIVAETNADSMLAAALQNFMQRGTANRGVDVGTVNNLVVTLIPTPPELLDGFTVWVKAKSTNTGPTHLSVNGFNWPIVLAPALAQLVGGEIAAGAWRPYIFDAIDQVFQIMGGAASGSNPSGHGSVSDAVPVAITGRTIVSGSVPGSFTTAWSGSYTKKSATSNLVIVPNVNLYNAASPNTGVAPTTLRMTVGSAAPVDTPAQVGFQFTNAVGGVSTIINDNAGEATVTGLAAGAQAITLQLARFDSLAWYAIVNANQSDNGAFPANTTSFLLIEEVEP